MPRKQQYINWAENRHDGVNRAWHPFPVSILGPALHHGVATCQQATFIILDAAPCCFVTNFIPQSYPSKSLENIEDSLPKMGEKFWEEDSASSRSSPQEPPANTLPNRPAEGRDRERQPRERQPDRDRERQPERDRERQPEQADHRAWLVRWLGLDDSQNQSSRAAQNEALTRALQSQLQEANAQAHLLHNQLQESQSNLRHEQASNQRLRQKLKAIEFERDNMSLNIKNQEAQIRQVQALAFVGIGGDSWAAGDDGTIRTELENLHIRIKNWAKRYANEDMGGVKELPADEHGSFIQLLTQVVRRRCGAQNVIEHLESASFKKKAPVMCLQGLLSQHVYAKIISRPFFVLGDAGEALQSVYMAIGQGEILYTGSRVTQTQKTDVYEVNEGESHLWRSKTLRLLVAPPPDMQQGGGSPQGEVPTYSASQTTVCHDLAAEFYNSPAKHLIGFSNHKDGNTETQCFSDLESIVQSAGELSSRLWTRRTALGIKSLLELENEPFVARSRLMKAHPLHRLYEDDKRCDGWAVSIVTHPAVLGFGSSDGKDYSTARVWMKAEVWLSENI